MLWRRRQAVLGSVVAVVARRATLPATHTFCIDLRVLVLVSTVMMFRTHVAQHELGLVFRRGDLAAVLAPGSHLVPQRLLPGTEVLVLNRLDTRFAHARLDVLAADPRLAEHLTVVDLADDERALVFRDGRLFDFVGAGRFAYWVRPRTLKVERFRVGDLEFRHPQREAVLALPAARGEVGAVDVAPHQRLLVRRGGELVATLGAGRHAFWLQRGLIQWQLVDLREQIADIAGQEMLTADKVSLRINLLVSWRIVDPVAATTVVTDAAASVYREAQLALRSAVGGRELDRLLLDKDVVGDEVRSALVTRVATFGCEVQRVGLRDLVLPGDMKLILNQVIEAQKQAEANLIRRREEAAAARSQANTARLLAEHPALLRLKELETMETLAKGGRATFVFGGSGGFGLPATSSVATG
jgi:regulator of protease activity HflC (stomatin/prohibitin superfamily)